jgi:peptide-methionine (S)-S-oxide reductase
MFGLFQKSEIPAPGAALPGRPEPIPTATTHFVSGRPLKGPHPEGMAQIVVGMGCFWGVERMFWTLPGVWVTAAGYAGGATPNPTYREVCSGQTGHNEVVLVTYDPAVISFDDLLRVFWEGHDPTQGMRQGNDRGTQYRSGLYVFDAEQRAAAEASRAPTRSGCRRQASGRSPPRSSRPGRSTTPRTITSSISPRIRAGIAAWAAPVSPVRSGWAWPDARGVLAREHIFK